ncbi:TPA: hypothetical protein N0F65_002483 [Lagenidium giganteum]|uniref:Kinesin motor domain-containing protein n=1 Tax=Lagenidium giganteum TaxID=4803 RepID=A0AAV2YWP5_9STRA|nr:TPA: hypothetical protein N0F65_002483 [Lagenidium giganteum]
MTSTAATATASAAEVAVPTAAASSRKDKTKRHWQVLRNALLRKPLHDNTSTASALSTDFYRFFSSSTAKGDDGQPDAAPGFEWSQFDLNHDAIASKAPGVRVHEKQKERRVTLTELLSHKVNQGVDNTGNIRTWPSEQIVLHYLLKHKICQELWMTRQSESLNDSVVGLNCCELGSGMVGLASLGLLAHAPTPFERFLITDGNPQSVDNLKVCIYENQRLQTFNNAHHNFQSISAELLRWDRTWTPPPELHHAFDLVFASDCLFFEEFHIDLLHTIKMLLRPTTGKCFLLQPNRGGSMIRFCDLATEQGLQITRVDEYDDDIARRHAEYQQSRSDYVPDVHLPVLLHRALHASGGDRRGPNAQSDGSAGNVRVCCRVRPQNAKEEQMAGAKRCVSVTGNTIEVKTNEGAHSFAFDSVFGEGDGQHTVFESVARPVVQDIMDGYNATIFAYGQTSSGKTYTMEGRSIDDPELRGIIPRTATELFNNVMAADENIEFIVKVSYIEIYMERVRDLLDPYKSKVNLQVREDAQRGIFVEGMTEICVTSDDELLSTMRDGAANRAVAATGMNEGSSRSHSVFMVTLYQRNLENQATKTGKLFLVDLAGSEMVRKTGASGKQLEEAKTINKSLSALGMVINALTDPNVNHVPYRDSKLTRVLQESIGGNSRTALIINVSPSSFNTSETLSTLRFGHRAKSIKNKAVVNEQRSVEEYKVLLAKAENALNVQQNYIIALEARLAGMGDSTFPPPREMPPVAEGTKEEEEEEAEEVSEAVPLPPPVSTDEEPKGDIPRSPSMRVAKALEELQERVVRLEEELAEEKQESTRRAEEIRLLTAQLDDKTFQLEATQKQFEELRKDKDQQEAALEEKLRQKETLFAELKTEFERLSFEHQELAIHADTVQSEYETLLHDLPASTAAAAASPGKLAAAVAAQSPATTSVPANESTDSTKASESLAAEEKSSEPEEKKTEDAGESTTESNSLKERCATLEDELREYEKEFRLLQVNSEREKARLMDDLDRKKAQIRELELQLDRSNTATPPNGTPPASAASPTGSGMSARERQHMRSIQQKLEQLVAVHRQLLRKYASLELELSEAKKKLILRDERIKQVEANNRIMAGNMRAQAEKHVEELTHLRDQIADFRGAQRSHFEAQMNITNDTNVIKTLRGGSFYGEGVIRPIRGGGRRKTGVSTTGQPQNAYPPASPAASGFLTRLFGKSS